MLYKIKNEVASESNFTTIFKSVYNSQTYLFIFPCPSHFLAVDQLMAIHLILFGSLKMVKFDRFILQEKDFRNASNQNKRKKTKNSLIKVPILEKNPDVRFGRCDYTNIFLHYSEN